MVSIFVLFFSFIALVLVSLGLVIYFRTPHQKTDQKLAYGIILLIFIYLLFKRVFYFLDFGRYFIYDVELLAYFGIMAWISLRHKGQQYPLSTKLVIVGIALLAIVFISFYGIVFIEKTFRLCGITNLCRP